MVELSKKSSSFSWGWAVVLLVLITIIALAVFLTTTKKKKKKNNNNNIKNQEDDTKKVQAVVENMPEVHLLLANAARQQEEETKQAEHIRLSLERHNEQLSLKLSKQELMLQKLALQCQVLRQQDAQHAMRIAAMLRSNVPPPRSTPLHEIQQQVQTLLRQQPRHILNPQPRRTPLLSMPVPVGGMQVPHHIYQPQPTAVQQPSMFPQPPAAVQQPSLFPQDESSVDDDSSSSEGQQQQQQQEEEKVIFQEPVDPQKDDPIEKEPTVSSSSAVVQQPLPESAVMTLVEQRVAQHSQPLLSDDQNSLSSSSLSLFPVSRPSFRQDFEQTKENQFVAPPTVF
jgi:large-conductance mechanosensitive channel